MVLYSNHIGGQYPRANDVKSLVIGFNCPECIGNTLMASSSRPISIEVFVFQVNRNPPSMGQLIANVNFFFTFAVRIFLGPRNGLVCIETGVEGRSKANQYGQRYPCCLTPEVVPPLFLYKSPSNDHSSIIRNCLSLMPTNENRCPSPTTSVLGRRQREFIDNALQQGPRKKVYVFVMLIDASF